MGIQDLLHYPFLSFLLQIVQLKILIVTLIRFTSLHLKLLARIFSHIGVGCIPFGDHIDYAFLSLSNLLT